MSPVEAAAIISRLRPGERFVYFTGDLAIARLETKKGTDRDLTPTAEQVDTLAHFMLRQGAGGEFSFGDGSVVLGHNKGFLTKRRIDDHLYEYLFTKRR